MSSTIVVREPVTNILTITTQGIPGNVAELLDMPHQWSKYQHYALTQLTPDMSNDIDWSWLDNPVSYVNFGAATGYTLNAPTGLTPGDSRIFGYQNGTGNSYITFSDSVYKLGLSLSYLTLAADSTIEYQLKSDGTYIYVEAVEYL